MESSRGELLAIADDLTGALEVGAQFAAQSIPCAVSTDEFWPEGAAAAILHVATRHMKSEDALRAMRRAAGIARIRGIERIYLKTDSTLRGRIAESLLAVREEFPERSIVYVPAYPQLGRAVRDGVLYVSGKALAETPFAADALNPVRESSISAMLEAGSVTAVRVAKGARGLARILTTGPACVVICDGEEEKDLVCVANELSRVRHPYVAAGTGGFARYWAGTWNGRVVAFISPRAASGLVVVGSRHPASIEQADCAASCGTATFGDDTAADRVAGEIRDRRWAILRASARRGDSPLQVAQRCGRLASEVLRRSAVDALVIFGGDTAAASLAAIGCSAAWPRGELLPGIPVSNLEVAGRNLLLVTKAGGFGSARTLTDILTILGRPS